MRKLMMLVAAGALLLPPFAGARDWHGAGPRLQAQEQPLKRPPAPPQREREGRSPPGDHDKRKGGRLTQEERRDLHRDLDRANREIYQR